MIQHIRRFHLQRLRIALHGGDYGLHGLFAELLGAVGRALRKQAGRIAFVRRGGGALGEEIVEVFDRESHQSILTGRPAWARRSLACLTLNSPKWKIDAASTALAWPSRMPSTM